MMFYDWRECVMSVLAPQNISSAVVLTLGNNVVLLLLLEIRALQVFDYCCCFIVIFPSVCRPGNYNRNG